MAEEKTFTINLRREFIKKPNYNRSKKAINAKKEYTLKQLKTKEVKIGQKLNLKIWERGRKNPPPKVKVKAIVEDNISYVDLPGFEFIKQKPKEEKKSVADKLLGKKTQSEQKQEEKKAEEKELAKEAEKEIEVKEKKEHKKGITAQKTKTQEEMIEKVKDEGQKIGRTGKKGSK